MRTVVIVAPDFSPSSLPSAIRPRLFANHLGAFGWHPIVITTRAEFYDYPLDFDNESLVAADVEVIRTAAISSASARRFGIGDIGIRSLRAHWQALRELVAERTVDLILISVPPCVPMLLGRMAKRTFGIPYVIDYQDPWGSDAWWKVPRAEHPPKWPLVWAMAKVLEPLAVRQASALTGVSLGATEYAATLQPGVQRTEIPFGAEPMEFAFLRARPRLNPVFDPRDGKLHLVYTGVIIPGMYPALRVMLQAVRLLVANQPELGARLQVHFIGTSYAPRDPVPQMLPLAEEAGVAHLVTERAGRVSYLDALQILLDSTCLLIVGTGEAHYTPSKIFPCALAGKPILAVLHQASSGPELLWGITGTSAVVYGDDGPGSELIPELCRRLTEMFIDPIPADPDVQRLAPFTARAMAGRLATVFDGVISAEARINPEAERRSA